MFDVAFCETATNVATRQNGHAFEMSSNTALYEIDN